MNTPTRPLTAPELSAGERLGVWRLQRPVGPVASGQWWRAQHALGAQSALVLVYGHAADAGAVLLRMAQAEGQPWIHPDVAWPLDSGLTGDGRPYVVMPLLDGEPLGAALGTASLRRRLDWVLQLCELLLLARAEGLSLIELDPSLLWVGPQQQLRLHALSLVRTDAEALRLGSLQGQISQAARPLLCPVAAHGEPGGAQAQVYSVGMLMCWLVNGRYPQDEGPSSASTAQLLSQWVSLPAGARAALDALLHAAVHADPAQRPADLDALAQAVEAWLEQTGAAAAGTPALAPAAEPSASAAAPVERTAAAAAAAPEGDAAPPPKRAPAWALGLIVLTLAVGAGLLLSIRHP